MRTPRWVWWWASTSYSRRLWARGGHSKIWHHGSAPSPALSSERVGQKLPLLEKSQHPESCPVSSPNPQQHKPAQSGTVPQEWDELPRASVGLSAHKVLGVLCHGCKPFHCPQCWKFPALLLGATKSVLCCSAVPLAAVSNYQDGSCSSLRTVKETWLLISLCLP